MVRSYIIGDDMHAFALKKVLNEFFFENYISSLNNIGTNLNCKLNSLGTKKLFRNTVDMSFFIVRCFEIMDFLLHKHEFLVSPQYAACCTIQIASS